MSKSKVIVKRQMESKEINAVRLMTVHGSKGLQAAVVFLPDTFKVKDSLCEQRALFDDKYVYYPLNRNAYEDNCLKAKDYNDMKADEEHRRLYDCQKRQGILQAGGQGKVVRHAAYGQLLL